MLHRFVKSIKSVFSKEPEVVSTETPITMTTAYKTRKEVDRSTLTSFQVAAGYAALMKYQQDKLLGKAIYDTLDDMYAELNQRLGTNKSRSAWTVAIKNYMNTIQYMGD
jgi:hypothetical protein